MHPIARKRLGDWMMYRCHYDFGHIDDERRFKKIYPKITSLVWHSGVTSLDCLSSRYNLIAIPLKFYSETWLYRKGSLERPVFGCVYRNPFYIVIGMDLQKIC
ncbi:hypothetical protein B0O99DRAFT_312410 [Bisporella sp. PMI_857]|nr:hypothetical protein B0O99DRAFT_312410 [Bisporella sp. PMI_857]